MKVHAKTIIMITALSVVLAKFDPTKAHAQPMTNMPPIILCHPEDQLVYIGTSNVTFQVIAEPHRPMLYQSFTYQWQANALPGLSNYINIDAATNATYTIANPVTTNDVAFYRVVVSGYGTTFSEPAALQVYMTNNPVTVWGTPVYWNGGSGSCPGCYIGYVNFTKSPLAGWGWQPSSSTPHKAEDRLSGETEDTKIEFVGMNGDSGCAVGAVIVPHPTISNKYRFSIYFPCGGTVGLNPYRITLYGFLP